jgi:phosphomannomutase
MDEKAVFKRYDVRGKYPEEIDEIFAERMGKAIGTFTAKRYKKKEIVVTKDTKKSSEELKKSLIDGILSTGCKVLDAGTGPTDYTAFTGQRNNVVSVQVTSSHLPVDFNGFKFMYPEGNGFTNPDLDQVKQLFREEDFKSGKGKVVQHAEHEAYKKQLKKFLENFDTDFNKKIVVDTLGGATHPIIVELLEELGVEVVDLAKGKEKTPYRDPPNPKPEMLEEMKTVVNKENADLGIATDMDGDRITVYKNCFISGDQLFGAFAQLLKSDIVASIDTSKSVEKLVESNGQKIEHTRIGDPFVMEKAIQEEVKLAGEPNGHYAFLDFVPYSSGILSGLMAAGIDLEPYLSKIPDRHIERKNVEVKDKEHKMEAVKPQIRKKFDLLSDIDGIKFRDGDTTVLLRASGSSPKIRIVVESKNPTTAEEVCWKLEKLIQNA